MGLNEKDVARISMLIFKYQEQTLTADEELELNNILTSDQAAKKVFDDLGTAEYIKTELDVMNRFNAAASLQRFHEKHIPKKEKPFIFRISTLVAAASVILVIGLGLFYFNKMGRPKAGLTARKIVPGKNTATLVLANGKRITLDNAKNGALVTEAGVTVTKTKEGQIIYTVDGSSDTDKDDAGTATQRTQQYNTLFTANGETFEIRLPDGSKVWLNAATSLKYPISFSSHTERKVELSGEAYFEVSKDKVHPFVVESRNQRIQVIGTHFNVNAYQDEPATKTTLLAGAVKINDNTILKPNQQAVLTAHGIKVMPVIAEAFIDWKQGVFNFEYENIQIIMRKISRWYDVEVIYEGTESLKETYTGTISRSSDIQKVLETLTEISELKLRLKGRTIIVSK